MKDGGPAFPTSIVNSQDGIAYGPPGMSLRDWLAGQALPTALASAFENSHKFVNGDLLNTSVALNCYRLADAMLAERERTST